MFLKCTIPPVVEITSKPSCDQKQQSLQKKKNGKEIEEIPFKINDTNVEYIYMCVYIYEYIYIFL